MKKSDVVKHILKDRLQKTPTKQSATEFAPTNIALCKYWGKRDQELNLPVTSSLSISLGDKGAKTEISLSEKSTDTIILNNQQVDLHSSFATRLIAFLNLFRPINHLQQFNIHITSTVPIAAGLASSACGFASITKALNNLFEWQLEPYELSILARLGSGSASRSIWSGFVEWHAGQRADGMDSHGEWIDTIWPELCVGLLILNDAPKSISSREAMQRTIATSPLYTAWPDKVKQDRELLQNAIQNKDFQLLGKTAESNALTMHATMMSAWPSIIYSTPETLATMHTIWQLRAAGLPLFFTQDAGPNLKLLFMNENISEVREQFPHMDIIRPFGNLTD